MVCGVALPVFSTAACSELSRRHVCSQAGARNQQDEGEDEDEEDEDEGEDGGEGDNDDDDDDDDEHDDDDEDDVYEGEHEGDNHVYEDEHDHSLCCLGCGNPLHDVFLEGLIAWHRMTWNLCFLQQLGLLCRPVPEIIMPTCLFSGWCKTGLASC